MNSPMPPRREAVPTALLELLRRHSLDWSDLQKLRLPSHGPLAELCRALERLGLSKPYQFFLLYDVCRTLGGKTVYFPTVKSLLRQLRKHCPRATRDRVNPDEGATLGALGAAGSPDEIVAVSEPLRRALKDAMVVAATDSTVLLQGETGTGKELVARAIHRMSPRRDQPLVIVNCAAVPSTLIESELFGHEKGAFTGAIQRRRGRFELAHGGTLFLDEVGDIPLETQVKLLRVLQEQTFERVGGDQTIQVNVRLIAATNQDLEAAVAQKTFRADLFYRLNVFPITLPPLRERREGIVPLALHFARKHAARMRRALEGIAPATLERLQARPWPGNARELENVIERAVIYCQDGWLHVGAEGLPTEEPAEAGSRAEEQIYRAIAPILDDLLGPKLCDSVRAFGRVIVRYALRKAGGNQKKAAEALGVPSTTFWRKIRQLGIDPKSNYKPSNP